VGNLGGGSDHVGFYTHVGVPSAWTGMGGPSLYHSGYDDFAFYERFCDPEFVYGPTPARVDGLLALRLANADLLPYAVDRYATDLRKHTRDLQLLAGEHSMVGDWAALDAAIDTLAAATADYEVAATVFVSRKIESHQLQRLNEALLQLEKSFLLESGLQGRPWSRSLFAAPDPFSGYASWMLPGLRYEILEGDASTLAQWLDIYTMAVTGLSSRVRALTTDLTT
jgi:N-acetylated-alpha-linked acidic dipeptidase